jgi:hypothetical protein
MTFERGDPQTREEPGTPDVFYCDACGVEWPDVPAPTFCPVCKLPEGTTAGCDRCELVALGVIQTERINRAREVLQRVVRGMDATETTGQRRDDLEFALRILGGDA